MVKAKIAKGPSATALKRKREVDQAAVVKNNEKALDRLENETPTRRKKQKVGTPARPEYAWNKMIADNFLAYGFTVEELKLTQMPGTHEFAMSKLEADRESWRLGEMAMGQQYFQNFRQAIRNPDSPMKHLDEIDENEAVDEEMEEAIEGGLAKKRNLVVFDRWVSKVKGLTLTAVCVLFKFLLMIPVYYTHTRQCRDLHDCDETHQQASVAHQAFAAVLGHSEALRQRAFENPDLLQQSGTYISEVVAGMQVVCAYHIAAGGYGSSVER